MALELVDYVTETDGVELEDFPPEVQGRIDDALGDITGGEGGPGNDPENPPQSIVVDADGGGDYESIQAAVDAATSGDVIFVEPGEYDSVSINASGAEGDEFSDLTIEGPNAGIPGDSDARGDEATIVGGVFMDNASDIVVDGFELEREVGRPDEPDYLSPEGVFQLGSTSGGPNDVAVANVAIENNVVTATPNQGQFMGAVYIEDVAGLQVNNNLLTQTGGNGNPVRALLQARMDDVLTYDGNVIETAYGMLLDGNDKDGATYSVDATITDNTFNQNLFGIIAVGTEATADVENNDFNGGDVSNRYVENSGGAELDLAAILNDLGNTFEPNGEIDEENDRIVPVSE